MNDGKIDQVRIIASATDVDDAQRVVESYANRHFRANHLTLEVFISPSPRAEFADALAKAIERIEALSK